MCMARNTLVWWQWCWLLSVPVGLSATRPYSDYDNVTTDLQIIASH